MAALPAIMEMLAAADPSMSAEDKEMLKMFDSMKPMLWTAAGLYLLMGVGICWLGVGSCLCRRWAWKLLLAFGWLWTGMMAISVVSILFLLPSFMGISTAPPPATPGASPVPPGMSMGVGIVVGIIEMVFLAVPGVVLIIIYNLRNVRVTCEFRDPTPRWTDSVPVPVLVVWLGLTVGCVMLIVFSPVYAGIVPGMNFGIPPVIGGAGSILIGILFGVSAWLISRLKPLGLFMAIGTMAGGWGSVAYFFGRLNIIDFYDQMGMPQQMLDEMSAIFPEGDLILWPSMVATGFFVIGYLVWTSRYFFARAESSGGASSSGRGLSPYEPPSTV